MNARVRGKGTTRNPHSLNRQAGQGAIGQGVPLVDGYAKTTGEAIYTDDIRLPLMLHACILRSTEAHARIKSIDTRAAQALPGVRAVVTGRDLPRKFGVLPVSQDESPMAVDKVRHQGDCVAGVAADTEAQAREACWAIAVEYETLPDVQNYTQALKPTSDPIHAKADKQFPGANIHKAVDQDFGDVEGAFADAQKNGVRKEASFNFLGCSHAFTEPHSTVAHWEASDRLVVYSAQQVVHYLHRALAQVFGLPPHQVRVVKPMVGGGFGGKSDPFPHEFIAALLAQRTRRPVRLTFDREEVFLTNHGRHPTTMQTAMAADREGRILALDHKVQLDGGAYGSFGVVTSYYNGVLSNGPYLMPNFRYQGRRFYSNKPPHGAMRGHGSVNARFATETLIDEMALELGLDPIDMRLANLLPENTLTPFHKFRITSNGLKTCIEEVRRRSGWDQKHGRLPYGRGIGIGCGMYISGSNLPIHWNRLPQSTVHLKLDLDGGITAHTIAADTGQGSDTMLAQIVAGVLGVSLARVRVKAQDTDLGPVDIGSYSSRVTFMNGNAARKAAEELRSELNAAACKLLGIAEETLEFADERIFRAAQPDQGVNFMLALEEALDHRGALIASGCYETPKLGADFKGASMGLSPSYSFSAFITELSVDPETGFVKLHQVWAAHDCGYAINPLAVEGQIEGSIHMGIGQALYEGMRWRRGLLLNPNLLDYKIPTPFETPPMEIIIVESMDPEGPFGAKECGEGALAPIIPAIGNAIHDAVGVRLREVPMTPERILAAIEARARVRL